MAAQFTSQAIANHALLSIDGLTIYDLDDIPTPSNITARIPCMFPVFFDGVSGLDIPTGYADSGDVVLQMPFLALVNNTQRDLNISGISGDVVQFVDDYLDALMRNSDLSGALSFHLSVAIEMGVYPWGSKEYAGFIARHTWRFLRG